MTDPAARFLSAEDLDLVNLSEHDFASLAQAAFRELQSCGTESEHVYRHGCLAVEPGFEHLLPAVRSGLL
jgi:hypothetical protein